MLLINKYNSMFQVCLLVFINNMLLIKTKRHKVSQTKAQIQSKLFTAFYS